MWTARGREQLARLNYAQNKNKLFLICVTSSVKLQEEVDLQQLGILVVLQESYKLDLIACLFFIGSNFQFSSSKSKLVNSQLHLRTR